MRKLLILMAGALLALCYSSIVWAADVPAPTYEYTADEVAENQGAVAYWYAWGFNYAFGHFPAAFAELKEHGLPLRDFSSPHTGEAINFDDGSLDFDGDMTYAVVAGGVEIHIKTSKGVVDLPGTLSRTNECGQAFCCEVMICKEACWKVCDDKDAACKILQWMMWHSFETHNCRYGYRPVDEKAWMASGFAPLDANWRELFPYMNIKLVYGKCELKKAFVKCCAPCPKCSPCSVAKPCGKFDDCKQATCATSKSKCDTGCGQCKPKSESKCNNCKPATVVKPTCDSCNKCKPKCENECNTCKPVAVAKAKCDNCNKCEPKCENKCGKCESKCEVYKPVAVAKAKCDSCNKCKPKCENKCGKCGSVYQTSIDVPANPSQCGCDAWEPYTGLKMVKSLNIAITASERTAGPLKLELRNSMHQQIALIRLPGPIEGKSSFTYTFVTPVKASDLMEAVLINDGDDPATLTNLRVVGLDNEYFSYVYVDHTCPGAVVGPGGCPRMEIY